MTILTLGAPAYPRWLCRPSATQFFWSRMGASAGAEPEPIPIARLDVATVAAAFEWCGQPQVRERA